MKTFLSLLLVTYASMTALAQQPTPEPNKPVGQRGCCVRRVTRRLTTTSPTAKPSPATAAAADFYVGEAKVDVTKDETVVRLAMAQHGSVLIELPANDGPRYIIP